MALLGVRGRLLAAGVAAALGSATASATWSIVLIDTRTGEIGLASATCLAGFDLRANTPVLITGVGGATAQSFVDQTGQNKVFVRDGLADGLDPDAILAGLSVFDSGHQTRQYGIADVQGRAATFSGTGAAAWKGGRVGRVGDIVYAIQGNILTGAPVVDMAVHAVETTEGDLPAKLMAAMEAARSMGGDGRCSCDMGAEACGSPPAEFEKSAHIAYLMVARAGDRDGCASIYRVGLNAGGAGVGEFTMDGRMDVIAGRSGGAVVMPNTTEAGDPFVTLGDPIPFAPGGIANWFLVGDVTGDGLADVVTFVQSADQVTVTPAMAGGGFGPPVVASVGDGPRGGTLADLDGANGLDIVVCNRTGDSVSVVLSGPGGTLLPTMTYAVGDGPNDAAAGDFDDDGDTDIVVVNRNSDDFHLLVNDGMGGFLVEGPTPLGAEPFGVRSADFDKDGRDDFAASLNDDSALAVHLQRDVGFDVALSPIINGANVMDAGDVDMDGDIDAIVLGAGGRFTVMRNDGSGALTEDGLGALTSTSQMVLADVDGDGFPDAVGTSSSSGVFVTKNQGGWFHENIGCGGGDYFMNFNVAFQSAGSVEPVFQLQEQFDEARMDLVGRPDAIASGAGVPVAHLVSGSGQSATLRIELRDWAGDAATHPIQSVVVEHGEESAGIVSIGGAVDVGGGAYEVGLTAGVGFGIDRLRVTVDDGVRPVVLMPEVKVGNGVHPGDFNADGVVNSQDFMDYLGAFADGDPLAEYSGGGELDSDDFVAFLSAIAG